MALAEMSTILAHEIRNPLASMELFAGLIAEDGGKDSPWISPLRAGIRQLSGTVNNVLNIHSGGNLHLAPVDLNPCMQSGVEFVRPIADQAGVDLLFFGGKDDVKIQGNENLLRQIILNLVCNAIRHTPAGGKVEVTTQKALRLGEMRAQVEVTDTGSGIAAKDTGSDIRCGLQRQRGHAGTWSGCLQEAHAFTWRGHSCFQPGKPRHNISTGVSDPMTNDAMSTVLVVDDEPGIRSALRANFLRHGWRVDTASCVREAISNLEGKEFDLVVSDVRMPDGTGMDSNAFGIEAISGSSGDTADGIRFRARRSECDARWSARLPDQARLVRPVADDCRESYSSGETMAAVDAAPAGSIVGRAPSLLRALHRARSAASTGADVLIEAESGTGKELLARFIHDSSDRCRKPFIAVNCAAVPGL